MVQHGSAPNAAEIRLMADVLLRRYRQRAGEVAASFAEEHRLIGDEVRAEAWSEVAARLDMCEARTLS